MTRQIKYTVPKGLENKLRQSALDNGHTIEQEITNILATVFDDELRLDVEYGIIPNMNFNLRKIWARLRMLEESHNAN